MCSVAPDDFEFPWVPQRIQLPLRPQSPKAAHGAPEVATFGQQPARERSGGLLCSYMHYADRRSLKNLKGDLPFARLHQVSTELSDIMPHFNTVKSSATPAAHPRAWVDPSAGLEKFATTKCSSLFDTDDVVIFARTRNLKRSRSAGHTHWQCIRNVTAHYRKRRAATEEKRGFVGETFLIFARVNHLRI